MSTFHELPIPDGKVGHAYYTIMSKLSSLDGEDNAKTNRVMNREWGLGDSDRNNFPNIRKAIKLLQLHQYDFGKGGRVVITSNQVGTYLSDDIEDKEDCSQWYEKMGKSTIKRGKLLETIRLARKRRAKK